MDDEKLADRALTMETNMNGAGETMPNWDKKDTRSLMYGSYGCVRAEKGIFALSIDDYRLYRADNRLVLNGMCHMR